MFTSKPLLYYSIIIHKNFFIEFLLLWAYIIFKNHKFLKNLHSDFYPKIKIALTYLLFAINSL